MARLILNAPTQMKFNNLRAIKMIKENIGQMNKAIPVKNIIGSACIELYI